MNTIGATQKLKAPQGLFKENPYDETLVLFDELATQFLGLPIAYLAHRPGKRGT